MKPYSTLRPIRRLILESMNEQYFCKVSSRSHRETLFQPASNQSTVFLIFAHFESLFFQGNRMKPYSALRAIRRLILEAMHAQYF